ncbi:Angiopoietin-related protein 7,Fibrinogen-like protein 1,Fibroleukin,Angiopoietin-1 [Mytilus edulis]|uniref:Angiopoietin-related protein 7,Fibrinogen-like protein 1,Fibroleukin,Angiopoietin-1 n=1 Tax=Mytilus edulis TaxID=6550 RepID=A0A8S3TBB8_MYTED|nr:Angiopoietin-related protein 7,Fibrinogen-like protein 1,Fibroleukin,Angiopoietin-1 [Mytilus edulis]
MDVCHKEDFECQHPNLNQYGHLQVGHCRMTNIFLKKLGISFLDCLKECIVTSQCKGINYRSHWPLCDIVGLSEDFTPETDCVYTDISKWSKSIAGKCRDHTCHGGEKCVYDGEKQKCIAAYGPIPKDCSDQFGKKSGVFTIFPNQHTGIPVFCDMDYEEGGWTHDVIIIVKIIQRRFDGSQSFDRDWNTYKRGFGKPSGEYWIGNDNLHAILSGKRKFKVKFILMDVSGERAYAEYTNFYVGNEESNYDLSISNYSGTAGDGVKDHTETSLSGMVFTTKDKDNDLEEGNCAILKCSGWWHRECTRGNINGKLILGNEGQETMHWYPWREFYSLQETTMMIKPIEK